MAEVNSCDLYCPRKALLGIEYRQGMAEAGMLRKTALAASIGARGVEQMVRAATCPQRNDIIWQPRQECAEAAQAEIDEHPLDVPALNEYERRVLAPYIDTQQE